MPRIALSQGAGCSSGVEHENLARLSTKVINLLETQYVGTDEDRGGKIFEFIEQIKNEIIEAIRQEMEEVANKEYIEEVMDSQQRFIKENNLEIEDLTKKGGISELSNQLMMMKLELGKSK